MLVAVAWEMIGNGGFTAVGDVNGDGFFDVALGSPGYESSDADADEGRVSLFLGSSGDLDVIASWSWESDIPDASAGFWIAFADVNGDGFDDLLAAVETVGLAVFHGSANGLGDVPVYTEVDLENVDELAAAGDVNCDGFDDMILGDLSFGVPLAITGRAYVLLGSAIGLDPTIAWETFGEAHEDRYGDGVGSAGDVNGDGCDDVVVGAPDASDGEIREGVAYLYLGSPTGPSTTPDWKVGSDQSGAAFGRGGYAARDIDGDGFDDLFVVDDQYSWAEEEDGRVSLFLGGLTGLATTAAWTAAGPADEVAAIGDVNADGFEDVAVGMRQHDDPVFGDDVGRVDFYLGSATGLAISPADTLVGNQEGALFGDTLTAARDIDRDGSGDLFVYAPNYDSGNPRGKGADEGRLSLHIGGCVDGGVLPFDDADGDSVADRCDACPDFDDLLDGDGDSVADDCDVCPERFDPRQDDEDADGVGNVCDPIVLTVIDASLSQGLSVDVDDARDGDRVVVLLGSGPIEVDGGPCPANLAPLCLDLGPGRSARYETVADADGHASLSGAAVPPTATAGATMTVQAIVVRGQVGPFGERYGIESNAVEVTLGP